MSPEQKQDLERRYEQFMALTPQERERIRRLHRQLDEDPQGRELRETMHRYHAWLGTLPAVTRYELRDLEPAERIARIKELREAAHRGMRQPTPEDRKAIEAWLDERVAKLKARLEESIGRERAEHFSRLSPQFQRGVVVRAVLFRRHGGRGPATSFEALAELRDRLSPESRSWLAEQPPHQQWKTLARWIALAVRPHQGGPHRGDGPPAAPGEHLDRFIEQLPPEKKDELLRLPPDEMQRELWLYFAGKAEAGGPPGRHEGPFRGPRPGIFRPGGVQRPDRDGGPGSQRQPGGPPSGRFRPGGPGHHSTQPDPPQP